MRSMFRDYTPNKLISIVSDQKLLDLVRKKTEELQAKNSLAISVNCWEIELWENNQLFLVIYFNMSRDEKDVSFIFRRIKL